MPRTPAKTPPCAPVPDPTPDPAVAPTFDSIVDAAERIRGQAVRTPLLSSPALDQHLGGRFFIKPETLQRTGSFKFRGAYTKISRLSERERSKGVVAFSSGNHAQGVAAAAGLYGIPATIVMPRDAPKIKIENTGNLGAKVVLYDRQTEDREAMGQATSAETGAVLVPPFDDAHVISGQGTVGLEVTEDMKQRGLPVDAVVCPCGGGGLLAGTALAVSHAFPHARIWGVEPEGYDDTLQSFEVGARLASNPTMPTICDALASPMPGALTFPVNKKLVRGIVSVTDAQTAAAMKLAYNTLKLVIEPGGAVALAAVLNGKLDIAGKNVVIICSGGNVDADLFSRIITTGLPEKPDV